MLITSVFEDFLIPSVDHEKKISQVWTFLDLWAPASICILIHSPTPATPTISSSSLSLSMLHFRLIWISTSLCTGDLLALELVSLGPDSSSDTGSGIGSESGAGNNYRLPTLFFFRSATYTSYYSYMQLNELFTIITFPAFMAHVPPA